LRKNNPTAQKQQAEQRGEAGLHSIPMEESQQAVNRPGDG
jgi:hypothetical protein